MGAFALSFEQRARGGMWGLLVGDALGVPYEFHPPAALPPADAIEMTPPPGFVRAHVGVPPGTWSDDGAQALCLLASLLERGRLDLDDVGARLLAWYERGELSVDGQVFDVGAQTATALRRLRRGAPAATAGPAEERANGNGSLMRVLPLALWHHGSDAELARDAEQQSLVTHGHLRARVCCALYCLWVRRALDGVDEAWEGAAASLLALYREAPERREELLARICPADPAPGTGKGYVVDTLRSARWAAARGDYSRAVRAAVGLGHDTDTTACVTGGFVGVRDGLEAIPARWRSALRGRALAEPWIERLAARGPRRVV